MPADILGTVVGHYRIIAELDTGGMGAVYRAEHELIGKPVAVKLLRPELCNDPDMLHRFFNEAKAATAIRHPGIVEVFDFGHHEDGRAYIVMEFLEGETLSHRIAARGRLAEREAAVLARGIAGALSAAHAKHIIHRDLKPDNVFLVPDPDMPTGERTKLLDFGIAKLVDRTSETAKTQTGVFMGTPAYMAPEQARGAGDIDPRADLYSLGCMLYEMVVGETPFLGDGTGELIALQLFGEVQPPIDRVPSLSPSLNALILQLLEKDPANRPASAQAVADLLSQSMPTLAAKVSDTMITQQGGPATARRPVVSATPRPARAATPLPTQSPRPTTLGSSVGQSVAPAPRKKSRAPLFAVLGVLIVGGAAAAVLATRGGGDGASQPAANEPEAPPQPTEIRLTLDLDPPGAIVAIDGEMRQVVDGVVVVPRDDQVHELGVSAAGYVARLMKIRATSDQAMTIALSEAPKVVEPATTPPPEVVKTEPPPPPTTVKKDPPKKKTATKKKSGAGKGTGDTTGKGSPIEETL